MRVIGYHVASGVYYVCVAMMALLIVGTEVVIILRQPWQLINPFYQIPVLISLVLNHWFWGTLIILVPISIVRGKLETAVKPDGASDATDDEEVVSSVHLR